ncbi:MAG: sugar ABC transporter permease [Clostridia bacterium]|nr:sugar ABC transporter permease [Clostridia bacterium]
MPGRALRKNRILGLTSENWWLLALTLPGLIYFFIWHYLPMFGLVIAFKDYTYDAGIFGSEWVGFDNFKFFFTSNDAWRITRNTVAYAAVFIVLTAVLGALVAILLNEVKSRAATKAYQTIMILPDFLSWVIVGFITYIFLNPAEGVLNQVLAMFGVEGIDWYINPNYWPYILTFVNMWKTIGMTSIMYYAALLGADQQLYEAATIDGANGLQKCWHISVPALVPLMTTLSILAVGRIFRGDFGLFYQIPRDVGALYPTTDVIDTYVYRGLRQGDMGITSAVGFFQSFVGVILVVVTNMIVKKIDPDNALF